MAPEAVEELCNFLTLDGCFANPASLQHVFGEHSNNYVELSRKKIAALLGCSGTEIVFTSGATESNNLAIKGHVQSEHNRGKHLITSGAEHKAVLDTFKALELMGYSVTYLRPDIDGKICVDQVLSAIRKNTCLVSLMHVNNETGYIQDIDAIGFALKQLDICFHVDASQSAGKLPIDLSRTPIDLLSISAHKFYGPKGVGCLYVKDRKNIKLSPLFHGGSQEYSLRPGTLATHQIAAMTKAFEIANNSQDTDRRHAVLLESILRERLRKLGGVTYNGDQLAKVPNIINLSFDNVSSSSLITALRNEIAISSGSACNSGSIEASHVLRSMGIEGDQLYGAVRVSFGRYTSVIDMEEALERICEKVIRLRSLALE